MGGVMVYVILFTKGCQGSPGMSWAANGHQAATTRMLVTTPTVLAAVKAAWMFRGWLAMPPAQQAPSCRTTAPVTAVLELTRARRTRGRKSRLPGVGVVGVGERVAVNRGRPASA